MRSSQNSSASWVATGDVAPEFSLPKAAIDDYQSGYEEQGHGDGDSKSSTMRANLQMPIDQVSGFLMDKRFNECMSRRRAVLRRQEGAKKEVRKLNY
mmetsp:Transcript_31043/g.57362  ORF Transcript_31043/g.57362 Transcript_31043/m.57362 type:complete len:97 (-) Transcript_31043:225-515(-)|eukprot:CAMPEP_0197448900 /NCGR_PEP_ID=MMETSP1175-20131217/19451_1 /TAXON_ID=1003142 /ORGANISM="Triceratium dubium, Strain CCMP147" /LENGTH=96 /DNA_ID=CAMNT_0042980825 /DNA_START=207 /DNA_END=497 /DNA_ORIENTATION=+